MNKESFYAPILIGVTILSVIVAFLDIPVFGQPRAQPTPTPTVINIIVMPTPTASTESVLAALRSEIDGELPTFSEFRSQMSGATSAVSVPVAEPVAVAAPAPSANDVQERTYLDSHGNTVLQRWRDVDGQRWLEAGSDNWLPCSMILAGDVPNWSEWPETFRVNMEATCTDG